MYVVRYDFILGEDITVPANCVLEFGGGSIKNSTGNSYKVIGNRTKFNFDVAYNIFDDTLGGGFELPYMDVRWIGGVSDYDDETEMGTDNATAFSRALTLIGTYYSGLYINLIGQYYIGTTVTTPYDLNIRGAHNTVIRRNGDSGQVGYTSPSLIVIGANTSFTLTGRENSFSYFTIHNIKVYGKGENSKFIDYQAVGAPSRVCVLEECEFVGLSYVLYNFNTTNIQTTIGNLTISKCVAYYNGKFLYCNSQNNNVKTVCNVIIRDSNIEHNSNNCIYINKAFSSIIIDNNILEGQPSPLFVETLRGDITIKNNYFEDNTGTVIYARSETRGDILNYENNFHNEDIYVEFRNLHVKGKLININDDSNISGCLVEDIANFKTKWLKMDNDYPTFVSFPNFNKGYNDSLYSEGLNDISHNIVGKTIPSSISLVDLVPNVQQVDDTILTAIYTSYTAQIGYYSYPGGTGKYTVLGFPNSLNILKGKSQSERNAIYMQSNNGGIYSILGFAVNADMTPADILVPDVNTMINGTTANRPTFTKPIGYRYFDTTLGKPICWNGTAWVDATGATV